VTIQEPASPIGAAFSTNLMNSRNQGQSHVRPFLTRCLIKGDQRMFIRKIHFAVPVFALLAGASWVAPAGAQSVQVITPAPAQPQSLVIIAPNAPPPSRVETIPPPPTAETHAMYWRPGHWAWDGGNWAWSSGQYVERPAPQAVWEPGHWVQQPNGGYVWMDGRWEG
jgi:hypothetical protein